MPLREGLLVDGNSFGPMASLAQARFRVQFDGPKLAEVGLQIHELAIFVSQCPQYSLGCIQWKSPQKTKAPATTLAK